MTRTASRATGHGDLAASLVLVFPLFLAYEIGVLFAGHVNGADVVTRGIYAIVGSRAAYLVLHAVVALWFVVWVRRARKWETLTFDVALPTILEAAIYALTLGGVLVLVVDRLFGLGAGDDVIGALGAGVHEELVFRLGFIAGLVTLLRSHRAAFPLALAISSLLFALAHHAGAGGEPFTLHAFVYRSLAGAAFGLMFWYRSLAHAVYAHVLYDLVVLWSA